MSDRAPIPLHVLTGFLGSGKTTLLARLVRRAGGQRLAVLVNDVGALALDPWLVEQVDEDVWALPSGCLCCALRGELYAALERVAVRRPDRIVLETSGLADPAPILHGLVSDARLAAAVRPAGVVAVVDALRAEELLATQPEFRRQLALADRIALSRTDLAPERTGPVGELLAGLAPGCEVRRAPHGDVDPDWLLGPAGLAGLRSAADARAWLHHRSEAGEPAVAAFETRALALDEPVELAPLLLWLRLVTQLDGPRLLRIKLLARERGSGEVFALQSAGRLVSPPRRLAARPDGLPGLQLVLVVRGLDGAGLDRLLASLEAAARSAPLAGARS